MGNKPSQEDQVPLLDYAEEIQPVFDELKLVIIGSKGAGKNCIGNAILRKKVFTYWKVNKCVNIKETVSGRRIHLTRTPGWKEDWKSSEKTKSKIVRCVHSLYDTGPHAVLLALKVNSQLSEATIRTLENFLTAQLWDHTIVIFTNGERLDGYTIEDHIRRQRLQPLIDKCGQRYFVLQKNDSNQITDTIEELIIRKNSVNCFKPNCQINGDKLLFDWKLLVKRIKSKIACISANKELLNSKNAEIERLKSIVQEKEREIKRLESICSRTQDPVLIDLHRENAELRKELMEKDTEIKKLKLWEYQRTHETHADYRNQLAQDVRMVNTRQTGTELQDAVSNGSVPRSWGQTLLKILEMLSNDELKKMKYLLRCNDGCRIPMSLIEGADRVDLADLMQKHWGKQQSVMITRDLIKEIPRNDDDMIKMFAPFLEKYGETWGSCSLVYFKEDFFKNHSELYHHWNLYLQELKEP